MESPVFFLDPTDLSREEAIKTHEMAFREMGKFIELQDLAPMVKINAAIALTRVSAELRAIRKRR